MRAEGGMSFLSQAPALLRKTKPGQGDSQLATLDRRHEVIPLELQVAAAPLRGSCAAATGTGNGGKGPGGIFEGMAAGFGAWLQP